MHYLIGVLQFSKFSLVQTSIFEPEIQNTQLAPTLNRIILLWFTCVNCKIKNTFCHISNIMAAQRFCLPIVDVFTAVSVSEWLHPYFSITILHLSLCSTVGKCFALLTAIQRISYILPVHLQTCNQTDKLFNNSEKGRLKKDEGEKHVYSLGCRKDVVDGHIIKQQHERLPILQLALRQSDTQFIMIK